MKTLLNNKSSLLGRWMGFALSSLTLLVQNPATSQVVINSTAGYSVTINVAPIQIVPSSMSCGSGYNYNVKFNYSIKVSGTNNSYNGNIGVQPQIMCNADNNGYYTISVPAPTVGASSSSVTYTGTLTTTTNPYRHVSDCGTSTVNSLGCDTFLVTIFGPGIPTATYLGNMVPLSVKFTSLNATAVGKQVELKWSTIQETDVKDYTVERSIDGSKWEAIGVVASEGNSTSVKNYSYADAAPKSGKSYYRVKQTDLKGGVMYSPLAKAEVLNTYDVDSESSVTIAPNPSSGKVAFIKQDQDAEGGDITIYNAQGKVVYHSAVFQSEVDLSNQTEGIYFAHIKLDSKVKIVKLAIKK